MIMAATMMLSMCGCGGKETNNKTKAPETPEVRECRAINLLDEVEAVAVEKRELDERFISAETEFSINILKNSVRNDLTNGKNVMISPESIMTCLGMTANGAGGENLTQMENVICPGITIDEFNQYRLAYVEGRETNDKVKFNSANSIWVRNDENRIKLNDGYLGKTKAYYNAGIFKEDFNEQTVDDINNWIYNETNEMIDNVIKEITEDAVMYLVNAIAFEGEWLDEYKDTQIDENGSFTNSMGEQQNVCMLHSEEGNYMHDENTDAFLKYYKGGEYAFMAMLPKEGIKLEDYIDSLSGEKFRNLYNDRVNNSNTKVFATIPEFTYDYNLELSDSLKALGMTDAFSNGADFSPMVDIESGSFYIGSVIHQTHIELDRKGTKAAAVTVVEMKEGCAAVDENSYVNIVLDRPFAYAIVDTSTGLPVFMGAVNTIK